MLNGQYPRLPPPSSPRCLVLLPVPEQPSAVREAAPAGQDRRGADGQQQPVLEAGRAAAAPATGGGGTTGFQDGLLLAVGAAAILAGGGSLAYRRRLLKNRQ